MKIAFASIPILFVLVMIILANNAYATCSKEPGFNCNNYTEPDLLKSPQIVNLKVSPSNPKVGDTFTVTATLVNNSTVPIVVDSGKCSITDTQVSSFTIMFDNHTKIKEKNLTCAGVGWSQILDPGKNITSASPDSTVTYVAAGSGTANVTVTFQYHVKNQDTTLPNTEQKISKSIQFLIHDVNETHAQKPPAYFASPLKQFKTGVAAKDVTCRPGFWLVFKTSDGSPVCVKTDAAYTLIHRGWAKQVSQTSLRTTLTVPSAPCDIPYPESNAGVAVLYMPANSTGKICATYHNPDSPTQSSVRVFVAKDEQQMAGEIATSASPDIVPSGESTIVYDIKTGSQAGFYGMSFFCRIIPLAVGYDNQSRIILDDFPWLYKNDICLSQTNTFQITGLSGIHVKYVTEAHRANPND